MQCYDYAMGPFLIQIGATAQAWFDPAYKLSLIATLGVLIWYANETRRIRSINTQQKDLQLLPAMMFYVRRRSGSERLFIRNIGFGTAVAVRIQNATFVVGGVKFEFRFHLTDSNTTLCRDEEREVGINFLKGGVDQPRPLPNFLAYYDPSLLGQVNAAGEAGLVNDIETPSQRDLSVHFRDITGQNYRTTLNFSEDGVTVISAPQRFE